MDRITETLEADLVQALNEIVEAEQERHEAGTITTPEFAAFLGTSQATAYRRLRKLKNEGVVVAAYVTRVDDWGDVKRVKGYRLAEAA